MSVLLGEAGEGAAVGPAEDQEGAGGGGAGAGCPLAQVSLLAEGADVAGDPVDAGDIESVHQLPERGLIAAVAGRLVDHQEDLPLALGERGVDGGAYETRHRRPLSSASGDGGPRPCGTEPSPAGGSRRRASRGTHPGRRRPGGSASRPRPGPGRRTRRTRG